MNEKRYTWHRTSTITKTATMRPKWKAKAYQKHHSRSLIQEYCRWTCNLQPATTPEETSRQCIYFYLLCTLYVLLLSIQSTVLFVYCVLLSFRDETSLPLLVPASLPSFLGLFASRSQWLSFDLSIYRGFSDDASWQLTLFPKELLLMAVVLVDWLEVVQLSN